MQNLKAIKEYLTPEQEDLLDELFGFYYEHKDDEKNINAMLLAIQSESFDLDELVYEIGENTPSPYHNKRYEWACENYGIVQQNEKEAISMGITSVSDIIAFAWSEGTRDDCYTMLEQARKAIDDLNLELN